MRQIIDQIGAIGGMQRFLMQMANIVVGGYVGFNASV